jgi:hypothetical protein
VISVAIQIVRELHQGLAGRLRKRLHLQGLQQVYKDIIRVPMAEVMP